MKLLTIDSSAAKRLFWSVCLGVAALSFLTSAQTDPVLNAASAVLIIAGLFPMYIWMLGDGRGLPIWPAFSGYTCISAALPVIQAATSIQPYSSGAIFAGLATTGGFIVTGTLVWVAFTARSPQPPRNVLMLESASTVRSLLICLAAGLLFNANNLAGWFTFPGNSMQVARGVAGGLGYLGTFALAYFHGVGALQRSTVILYVSMVFLTVVTSLTGMLLANAVPTVTLGLIGYTLGAGRVPWKTLAAIFVVMGVLHPGKYTMRTLYEENPEKKAAIGITTLPAFYSEWTSYGLESLGGITGLVNTPQSEDAASTVFERAGTLHMLLLVQEKSPQQVPFLNGLTYEPIPYLLLPRFLAPNKGYSHAGNILLSINYGLQDAEGARNTSIGWNLIAEAYANFGFVGVFIMALLLASLYSAVSRITVGVPITSFRFVSGLIVLAGVTNDNSFGVFITMQFQAVVGVALASFFLMKREPNPFYVENGSEGMRQEAEGMQQQKAAVAHTVGPQKWGGFKPPKWAPLSHRKAYELAARRRKAEAATEEIEKKDESEGRTDRPRQVAVPIQPYYYRSRKA